MIRFLALIFVLCVPWVALSEETPPKDKKPQFTDEEIAKFRAAEEKYKDNPAKMKLINQFKEKLGIADEPVEEVAPPPPPKHITTTQGSMETANAAYAKGDYSTALEQYKAMAAQGNQEANIYIGMMYEAGMGTDADKATAQAWYQRAAETPTEDYNNSKLVNQKTIESYSGNRISAEETAQANIINQEINDEVTRVSGEVHSDNLSTEISDAPIRSIFSESYPTSDYKQVDPVRRPLSQKKSVTKTVIPARTTHYKPEKFEIRHSKPVGHTEHQHPEKDMRELDLNTIDKS